MKIILISDTHSLHDKLRLPEGDMLIHAGDVCSIGTEKEAMKFLEWFDKLDYQHKIFIAGNHDFYFEREALLTKESIPKSIIYLNDSGVEINGIKIWGSPVQPEFFNWAFNRKRGAEIKKHWDLIPDDTDILITHSPAYSVLDKTSKGELVGCKELLNTIQKSNIKLHVCGHIHEAYGIKTIGKTTFVNAAVVNLRYQVVNAPIVFEWE